MAVSKEERFDVELLSQYKFKTKIIDSIHLTKLIMSECTKIKSKTDLLHRVNANFVQRINICIANDRNHIEDVIQIKVNSKNKDLY